MIGALLLAASLGLASPSGVDLNSATVDELQELPGIGPRKALAIVELRAKRPFVRVTQLLEVRGIGRKTLERLRPLIRVGGEPEGRPRADRGAAEQPRRMRREGGASLPGVSPAPP